MAHSDSVKIKMREEERSPWWRAADEDVIRLFRAERAAHDRKIVRYGFWVAVVTYIAFGLGDIFLFTATGQCMLLTRIVCGVAFLSAFEFAEYKGARLDVLHWIASSAIIVGSSAWLFVALNAQNQFYLSLFMVFATNFVLGANLYFNFDFHVSAFTSTIVTFIFVVATFFKLDVPTTNRVLMALFFVNILVFSLYLSRRLSVERYRTFVHSQQAKIQEQLAIERKEELNRIVEVDKLTGLKNRIAISREYVTLSRQRMTSSEQIGVFLVEIDNLARLETKIGKKIYEETLISVARGLNETAASHGGVAGRFGSNEFIVLSKVSSDQHLEIIAHQINECLKSLFLSNESMRDNYGLKARVGGTMTRNDANMDFTAILKEAEGALFMSRSEMTSPVKIFDPTFKNDDALRHGVVDLLGENLKENLLQVNYTPVLDRRSEIVRGYEAKVMLVNARGVDVDVAHLTETAAGVGELFEISRLAIERICSDLVSLDVGQFVAVELDAFFFRHQQFAEQFKQIIGYYGVPASSLAFQISDQVDVLLETQVQKNLEELNSLGVNFWLDRFGSLSVGLDWVRRYDFQVVKIDKGLINDIHIHKTSVFVEDLIRLLKNTGTQVLITGIDDEVKMAWAQNSQADLIVGKAFGLSRNNADGLSNSVH